MSYENGVIKQLRESGWDQCRITSPRGDRFGLTFDAKQLIADWNTMHARQLAAEAEAAQLRETVAALTAALTGSGVPA